MYHVALCEDELIFLEVQEKTCRDILDRLHIEYHITAFHNSADFIHAFFTEQKRYDLLLLDILMDGPNGMELARRLREADGEVAIIFITSSRDYALEGYDVNALHYLMKPVDIAALERLILSDYHTRFQNCFFMFESGVGKLRVAFKEIIYMETAGRRVKVTLAEGAAYYSGKLTELLAELPKERFVRCHQAFAVNIQNIRELTQRDAISVNGKKIPVSRTFAKDVQKAFARQLRES